jgi:hypothetical protein
MRESDMQSLWSDQPVAGATVIGNYRYSLWRMWNEQLPRILWIMLNPSTADASQNDPTLCRIMDFSIRWGYGSLEVVNLYAWRSPDPKTLLSAVDPIGPLNDQYIVEAAGRAASIVVGWGAHKTVGHRSQEVLALLAHRELRCLTVTKSGQPGHPLYISGQQPLPNRVRESPRHSCGG